jgi:hypothetical protein
MNGTISDSLNGEEKRRKANLRKRAITIGCAVLILYGGFILLMGLITPGFGPSDPNSFEQLPYYD